MKTKGLTFQQALGKNECVGISPVNFEASRYYKKDENGHLAYFSAVTDAILPKINLQLPILLGKWNLVIRLKPKSKTEQRIFNYWLVIWQNGLIDFYRYKPSEDIYKRVQHVFERHQGYLFTYQEREE